MRHARPIACLILLLALPLSAQERPQGYLAPGQFDLLPVLPPAPVKHDARWKADRAMFRATRRMVGSPRYALATADVPSSSKDVLRDFSCAAGVTLTPETAPLTFRIVSRAGVDTAAQTNRAKDFYKRLRPQFQDKGEVCESKLSLAKSYDYPSGHTTRGWTQATILAELMPDRATPILARGRSYGDSRIVCGAHNQSAVQAGYVSAAATMTVVRTVPDYQADFAAAKAELAALAARPDAVRPQQCDAEAALVAQRVF